MLLTGEQRRRHLEGARLLLIFTPDLAGTRPLDALERALPHVDVVQVRPKPLGDRAEGAPAGATITRAGEAARWCRQVLALRDRAGLERPPLVVVNDRVDVAVALAEEGLDGVHVGADDTPARVARDVLGPDLLLGLSTHGAAEVAAALEAPVDLLGFGPIFPTATKGYGTGAADAGHPDIVGPERAWLAAESSAVPVFPIGGIDLSNADQLDRVGRAAVGSAVLGAEDPAAAAVALRRLLELDER
ncbi:MAG: thiamine phosphate synthase [Planctomycetota bacterium]